MSAKLRELPVNAPTRQVGIDSSFARRVLGRREARRLAALMDEAEKRARARLEAARVEAEAIFADARAEAAALLEMLPDFAVLESVPAALDAIRSAADRHGLSMGSVLRRSRDGDASRARIEAVHMVAAACPHLKLADIGMLFGLSDKRISELLRMKVTEQVR